MIVGIDGEIFEFAENDEDELRAGTIRCSLVMRGRAINEEINLFEAMDDVSTPLESLYEALFELNTYEWKKSVEEFYSSEITGSDVLFIESLELEPPFRGKGIGAQVVRETIALFGSGCWLVACLPFPLQIGGMTSTKPCASSRALS